MGVSKNHGPQYRPLFTRTPPNNGPPISQTFISTIWGCRPFGQGAVVRTSRPKQGGWSSSAAGPPIWIINPVTHGHTCTAKGFRLSGAVETIWCRYLGSKKSCVTCCLEYCAKKPLVSVVLACFRKPEAACGRFGEAA